MKIKIPYTLNLLFPIIGWSILCSVFAYILVIIIANFKDYSAEHAFIILSPLYILLFCFLAIFRYGGIGFMSGEGIRLINKNVSAKGIGQGLSTEEIKNTLNALALICKGSSINVLASGLSIMVLTILTEWSNFASMVEIVIIICVGIITIFFACAFAVFYCQQAMSPAIKECRRILMERDEKVETIELSGIVTKFYFLFFLPFVAVLMILIAVYPINIKVATICFVGLIIIFIVDKVLLSYLSNALKELDRFGDELPMGERAVFITGSLDKEIVDLSESLNQASEKMYGSRSDLEKSQEEMGKRVKELEKFFELTVNREVKMVELKKELKKIKGDVQENDA
ncbi:MAG: hypothetical protein WC319_00555 [Candidatus Paceibacterota bacterium]|jgi:hypothetical protein